MPTHDRTGPAGQGAQPAPLWPSPGFVTQLRSRAAGTGQQSLLAGSINLIGLDHIKASLGARWTSVAERAHRIIRNTIARHMAPGDIYTEWRETNYIIVFASLGQPQARMKCRLIAMEIAKALLGEEGAEDLDVRDAVAAFDGSIALGEMGSLVAAFDSVSHAAETGIPAERARAPAPSPSPAAEPQFLFRPIWDPTLNVLSTYRCVPAGRMEANGQDPGAHDVRLQKRVLEELSSMARDGRKLLLILPVHFETVANGAMRRSYIESLANTVEAKLLVVEVWGVPSGVPQSRLIELLGSLRRHCRSVVAQLALEIGDLSAFKGTGVHAVGCDLGNTGASELLLMQLMSRFQRAAERAELPTYARGLRSHSLAAAALGAGFRYLEGDGIAKPVTRPEAVRGFQLFDMYRPLVGA